MIKIIDTDDGRLRIGMVPKYCDTLQDMHINWKVNDSNRNILEKLDKAIDSQVNINDILRYMRKISFSNHNAFQVPVKKIGVLVVDQSDNFYKSKIEAFKAKTLENIELFVIGIGSQIKRHKLSKIASEPATEHIFQVANYNDLPDILYSAVKAICPTT